MSAFSKLLTEQLFANTNVIYLLKIHSISTSHEIFLHPLG